jgi:hypothetical protein
VSASVVLRSTAHVRLVISLEVGNWPESSTAEQIFATARQSAEEQAVRIIESLGRDYEGVRVVGKPVVVLVQTAEEPK